MRQLVFLGKRRLEWRDLPAPRLDGPDEALVEPVVAARCDLDNAYLLHDLTPALRVGLALHRVDPLVKDLLGIPAFAGPFPYGHECVARVVETGPAVAHVVPGDLVVVPFQVSCGACSACVVGLTAHCRTERHGLVKAYGFGDTTGGFGGMVADLVRVPHASHMLVRVPEGVDPVTIASASDNIADGWRTVAAPLARQAQGPVLVLGGRAKSVALYAVAAAVALGSQRVDHVDTSPTRLDIAEALGASPIPAPRRIDTLVRSDLLERDGYPVTVDGSGRAGALPFALRMLAPGGVCTAVAFYVMRGTPVPLWHMYVHGGTLTTGLANVRADLPAVLSAVADGRFRPELVTTLVAPWDDAPTALLDAGTKVVLVR